MPQAPRAAPSPPDVRADKPKPGEPEPTVAPLAPNDFLVSRSTSLQAAANTANGNSTTNEPSLAHKGQTVFYTGNWYAARSLDNGQTFSYINPYTFFPSAAAGFCCDQVTVYEPSRDIFIWLLQYVNNASGNIQRIAVANGEADVTSNSWHYSGLRLP